MGGVHSQEVYRQYKVMHFELLTHRSLPAVLGKMMKLLPGSWCWAPWSTGPLNLRLPQPGSAPPLHMGERISLGPDSLTLQSPDSAHCGDTNGP